MHGRYEFENMLKVVGYLELNIKVIEPALRRSDTANNDEDVLPAKFKALCTGLDDVTCDRQPVNFAAICSDSMEEWDDGLKRESCVLEAIRDFIALRLLTQPAWPTYRLSDRGYDPPTCPKTRSMSSTPGSSKKRR